MNFAETMFQSSSRLRNTNSSWIRTIIILLTVTSLVSGFSLFRSARSQTRSKWESPCGQRERISDNYNMQTANEGRVTLGIIIINIADMATGLATKLVNLKVKYAQKRFNDTELVSDLESHMFQLTGRPKPRRISQRSTNIMEILKIIKSSTEDVARMVAYWEMAENGEKFDEPGESFEGDFKNIATDPQHGLYWMLCHMHMILEEFGYSHYSERTIHEIKSIEQNEVANSRAARHWRDYLVMVYLHKVLQTVKLEMKIVHDSLLA